MFHRAAAAYHGVRLHMIPLAQAQELVESRLLALDTDVPDLIVLPEQTITRELIWVFFYNSRTFIETGNPSQAIAGNAPFIVNRQTGEVIVTGTAMSVQKYIDEYESSLT